MTLRGDLILGGHNVLTWVFDNLLKVSMVTESFLGTMDKIDSLVLLRRLGHFVNVYFYVTYIVSHTGPSTLSLNYC